MDICLIDYQFLYLPIYYNFSIVTNRVYAQLTSVLPETVHKKCEYITLQDTKIILLSGDIWQYGRTLHQIAQVVSNLSFECANCLICMNCNYLLNSFYCEDIKLSSGNDEFLPNMRSWWELQFVKDREIVSLVNTKHLRVMFDNLPRFFALINIKHI